ncbi:MAG: hypothetical protein PVH68_04000 [Armatimonadota bacterium]|jgi:DNA-binding transcriptional regulator/RsmH inhibitor MraZ
MQPSLADYGPKIVQLVLPAVGLFIALWLLRMRLKEDRPHPETWCYFLYMLGIVACLIALMPDPEMERAAGARSVTHIALGIGLGALLIGAALHLRLKAQGRLMAPEERKRFAPLLLAVVVIGVLTQFLRMEGLERWLEYSMAALAALAVVLTIILIASQLLRTRAIVVNRMARLIQAHKYTEAIYLGESVQPHKRSPEVEVNLGVAYQLAGRRREARELFEQLRARPDLSEPVTAAVDSWIAEHGKPEEESEENA